MNGLTLLATAAAALALTFGTGFLVLRAASTLSPRRCWACSGATGCAVLGAIAFAAFLAGRHGRSFTAGIWLVLILGCLAVLRRRRRGGSLPPPRDGTAALLTLWVLLLAHQCLLPLHSGAFMYGDWWMHFDIARFYLGLRPPDVTYFDAWTIPSRTPLFSLFSAFFLTLFGDRFAVHQVVTILPGVALVAAAGTFLPRRALPLAVGLVSLHPFLVTMILYPWPKILAATCALLGLRAYLDLRGADDPERGRLRVPWGLGLWLGLAVLAHSATILYALALFLHGALVGPARRRRLVPLLAAAAVAGLVVLPWGLWVAGRYGLSALWTSVPTAVAATPPLSPGWWLDRLLNGIATLVPLPILRLLLPHPDSPDLALNAWLRFTIAVLPGALTLTGLGVLVHRRRRLAGRTRRLFGGTGPLLLLWGIAGSLLLQPDRNLAGLVGENLTLPVVLALLLVATLVAEASPRLQRLVVLLAATEFLASRGLWSLRLGLGAIPADDPNLLLKQRHQLLFARDALSSGWVAGCVVLLAAAQALLLWPLLRPPRPPAAPGPRPPFRPAPASGGPPDPPAHGPAGTGRRHRRSPAAPGPDRRWVGRDRASAPPPRTPAAGDRCRWGRSGWRP
ncbi:MAG: hypothetical protein VKI81_00880 [Synechococcaceae cyanobacterium]|nr:hypothetical protein [Synechococcaceae cyanobacterium]